MDELLYTPQDWCWKLETGDIFSSSAGAYVDEETAQAWADSKELYRVPDGPVDEEGHSSVAGLRSELERFGLYFSVLSTQEEQYDAERAAVEQKYSGPWDGTTGGILTMLQTTIISAVASGQDTTQLYEQYNTELTAMHSEFDAIDEKYGVS